MVLNRNRYTLTSPTPSVNIDALSGNFQRTQMQHKQWRFSGQKTIHKDIQIRGIISYSDMCISWTIFWDVWMVFCGHTSRPLLALCSPTRWAGSSMASSARESHGQKVKPDPKKIAIRISACLPYLFIGWTGNFSNKEFRLLLSARAQHTWEIRQTSKQRGPITTKSNCGYCFLWFCEGTTGPQSTDRCSVTYTYPTSDNFQHDLSHQKNGMIWIIDFYLLKCVAEFRQQGDIMCTSDAGNFGRYAS